MPPCVSVKAAVPSTASDCSRRRLWRTFCSRRFLPIEAVPSRSPAYSDAPAGPSPCEPDGGQRDSHGLEHRLGLFGDVRNRGWTRTGSPGAGGEERLRSRFPAAWSTTAIRLTLFGLVRGSVRSVSSDKPDEAVSGTRARVPPSDPHAGMSIAADLCPLRIPWWTTNAPKDRIEVGERATTTHLCYHKLHCVRPYRGAAGPSSDWRSGAVRARQRWHRLGIPCVLGWSCVEPVSSKE